VVKPAELPIRHFRCPLTGDLYWFRCPARYWRQKFIPPGTTLHGPFKTGAERIESQRQVLSEEAPQKLRFIIA
jgi:hypothetical protein